MKLMPKTACDICLAYDAKGRLASAVPVYLYYLQDHLGNNRVVVNQNDSVEQVNHYYPFGALFGESTDGDVQRFKYNGKELERMHGLDWYDYGARWHDAALGRWATVDPMAEKYYHLSPYNYCGNNPVKFVDPDGTDIELEMGLSPRPNDYFENIIDNKDDIQVNLNKMIYEEK